jgi:hypothetical protein
VALGAYVDPRLTPMPFEAAREALETALRTSHPGGIWIPARREILALTLAKCALETGRFQKIWNNNFGNIKAGASYTSNYTCITLNEVLADGRVHWFAPDGEVIRLRGGSFTPTSDPRVQVPPGHPQTRMRAYANRYDGAHSYVDFMRGRAAMWNALQVGEPVGFVAAMKRGRYFTADEAPYAKAVSSLFREFLLRLEGRVPDETQLEEPTWNAARGAAALAMARAAESAVDYAREGSP